MKKIEYEKMSELSAKHWWFWSKRKLLKYFIKKYISDKNNHLLEIGCGAGDNLLFLKKMGYNNIIGIDNSEIAIKFCQEKKLNVLLNSATALSLPNETMDVAIVLDVMEHIEKESSFISELWRVLKPNGYVFFTVPAYQFLWSYHDKSLGHKRRYTLKRLLNAFSATDWEVKEKTYFFLLIFPIVVLVRSINKLFFYKHGSDVEFTPEPFNGILKFISLIEIYLIKILKKLPFGTSIFLILQKK